MHRSDLFIVNGTDLENTRKKTFKITLTQVCTPPRWAYRIQIQLALPKHIIDYTQTRVEVL